ncbi:MAG: transposase [Bacillota bacterium]|nr:transposase [Bacillota bacterium]
MLPINKCVKIAIKNCKEFDKKSISKILIDLRYKTALACNRAITYLYTFALENMEYKKQTGLSIDEKEHFGKSYSAWVENRMNEIMETCNSANVAQTRQFVVNRFKDDKKKGLFKGEISLSNFKKNIPIIIHNDSYKILKSDKGFHIECGLFNLKYQKEHDIKRVTFEIDKMGNNEKSTLNKIIKGIYKQGSAQIIQDKKGKWYFIISFGFEVEKKELNMNRILGIDLGITKVATMQIWDNDKELWDRLSWKECMIDGDELIHYRQKIEARKKQMQIASKAVGNGRTGHGITTRMKPLEKMNDKVSKFRETFNHKVSKYIVDMAVKYNCGVIQMEDLSGFTEQQSESLLRNWSYYDLQNKVKYKAEEKGIIVNLINPYMTSKRCSQCGCINENNRDCKNNQEKFKCVVCRYEENADINAAKNIGLPNIEEIIKESLKVKKIN